LGTAAIAISIEGEHKPGQSSGGQARFGAAVIPRSSFLGEWIAQETRAEVQMRNAYSRPWAWRIVGAPDVGSSEHPKFLL